MDPYLEHPHLWHPFHTRLVVTLADVIERVLPPDYYVSVEERTYVASEPAKGAFRLPDTAVLERPGREIVPAVSSSRNSAGVEVLVPLPDAIRERYLQVRAADGSRELISIIEVLSPTNKTPGRDRDDYLIKRGGILGSETSLIEIDLLRAGTRMPSSGGPEQTDYQVLICRACMRPRAQLLAFGVREPIPSFPLPLRPGEVEPEVPLADAVSQVYERGRYHLQIDYGCAPEPALDFDDRDWSEALLRERGLRS